MQVTVVMPAYNAERYIPEAIESVLSQTHADFEFIIVDDGSTDGTLSIAESYAQKDRRIRLVSHSNVGEVVSLNRALDLAHNEWIVCMHADDVMLPDRIERQIAFVEENPDVAVASTCVYYINENGKTVGKYQSPYTSRARIEESVQRNEVIGFHHPAVIMRKSVIKEVGGYRQETWPCEDVELWNRVIDHGHNVLVQPEYLLKYRKHGSSSSTSVARTRLIRSKEDWVNACVTRRRSGEPEPSWEEFLAVRQQKPWWSKVDQERKDLAKTLYYAATLRFSARKYRSCALALLGATLLQPGYVLSQMKLKSARSGVAGYSHGP